MFCVYRLHIRTQNIYINTLYPLYETFSYQLWLYIQSKSLQTFIWKWKNDGKPFFPEAFLFSQRKPYFFFFGIYGFAVTCSHININNSNPSVLQQRCKIRRKDFQSVHLNLRGEWRVVVMSEERLFFSRTWCLLY